MSDSRWYFQLMGVFEARRGAFRMTRFRTSKDLSLLGYLITHPPHRFTREKLASLLWEELPPDRARNNLSVALSALRRAFENAGEYALIHADAQQIGLDPDRFDADVLQFQRALQTARACADPEQQYAYYAQAIGYYQGEFLPHVYDVWAISHAAWLQAERQRALERLAQTAAERGDLPQAKAWRMQLEPLHPTSEPTSAQRTRDVTPTQLPTPRCRLVGRETELARLTELLAEHRCVTIHGLSGFGKTSLALEVANRLHAQGATVHWIALTAISDARQLAPHIVQSLSLPAAPNPLETLQRYCATRRPLLFLDNLEHLLPDGAAAVAELLQAAPDARLCITSCLPLRIEGETTFPLAPLPCTGTPDNPAMAVFVERVRQRDACFRLTDANRPLIQELCERLEGVPLALELAAARLGALSLPQMLTRIHQRLDWLRTRRQDIEPRHWAMQTALDSAFGALTLEAQRALTQLSLLPDVWSLDAAQTATDLPPETLSDILIALCDASLVERVSETPLRYRMLEIIREYAQARLSDRQRRGVERRLCAWMLRAALACAPDACTARLPDWLAFWDERRALLTHTLDWLEQRGAWRDALRLIRATERYFYLRPIHEDALRRLQHALDSNALPPHEATEARLLQVRLLFETQQFLRAAPTAHALAQLDRRDRRRGWSLYWATQIAFILRDTPTVGRYWRQLRKRYAQSDDPPLRHAIHYLHGYLEPPDDPVAWREAGVVFARATGDPLLLGHALDALIEQQIFFGEYARALGYLNEAEQVYATLNDWLHLNRIQHSRAQCHLQRGELIEAHQVLDACAEQERQRGLSLHTTRWLQAQLLRWQGAPAQAIQLALSEVAPVEARRYWHSAAMLLETAAQCAGDLGDWRDALSYCERAMRLRAHEDDPTRACFNRTLTAYCRARTGEADALAELEACLQFWKTRGWRPWQANTLQYLADAYAHYNDYERAHAALQEAIALNEAMGRALALQKCRSRQRELPILNSHEFCKTL
ncbi:MAG: AAA family ATPase [Fimbriimonadales bacterium]|nr:AAA family ATPase [Fimbriimonadales bacterium]